MVKVNIKRIHTTICEVRIYGHTGYAKKGQDVVCAGVSSIAVGMMNAIDQVAPDTCEFIIQNAYIHMHTKGESDVLQLLLEAMVYQLQTLKESYQAYINITDQEV